MSKKTEIDALIRLLDDENEEIVANVTERLISYGEEVIFNLEKSWESSANPLLQERIENLIHKINYKLVASNLKLWLTDSFPDLYQGAEIIAKYHFSDLDSQSLRTSIEGIKQKIWLELNNDLTPLETISVFNHVFYGQLGFSGNYESASGIKDYCINSVLESKKGSSISIGILYIIIAQELNLPIYGVNLFNHFVLTYQKKFIINFKEDNHNDSLFYINPVNKGAVFGRQDIVLYLSNIKKEKKPEYFKAANQKDVIKALLGYIKRNFLNANEDQKADEIEGLIALFD